MVSRTPRRGRADPRQALTVLAGSDLFATVEQLLALEHDLRSLQPRLALRPIRLANQVLLVTAPSAGAAARLRQFEPSLLAGLRGRGWLVNKVRFRPMTRFDPPPPPPPPPKARVSDPAVAAVARLRDQAGPGDAPLPAALREALDAFVQRQRGYRAGS